MNNLLALFNLSEITPTVVLFSILGGLGLFLYGMNLMSSSLNRLAGSKLKTIIKNATGNIFKGFLIGIIITIVIQSSSATTVIVVGLISAGLIDLKHAIPIMVGAHIGTTVLAYIISFDFVSTICLPLIFIGAFIILLIKNKRLKVSGNIFMGLGLIFFGLEIMSLGFTSFAEQDWFINVMNKLKDNAFLSFFAGVVLTGLIQSSGAFIGIVQELYVSSSSMALSSAIALVIGSNIGTTVTAFIASISGNKTAKEAALSNTILVTLGAILFLPFISPLTSLFQLIENSIFQSRSMFTIAFFHTFFNVISSVMALSIINLVIILVKKILPDKESDLLKAQKLNNELIKTPSLALENVKAAILEMNLIVKRMYDLSIMYFNENNQKYYDEINALEEKVDLAEHLTHDYLMKMTEGLLQEKESYTQTKYVDVIRDFERIADHAVNFSEFLYRYYDEKIVMSDSMHMALQEFFDIIATQINETIESFEKDDKELAKKVIDRENIVDKMEEEYRLNVHSYITPGQVTSLDILYIDIVSNLERISDHTTNIAEMIIDPHMMSTIAQAK